MTALYELAADYRRLANAETETMDPVTGEVSDGFALALASLGDAIEAKAEGCAMVLRQLDADVEALREEERRISARRKSIENNTARLRLYVRDCMLSAGVDKLKSPRFTISVLAGRATVQVDDVGAVPDEYKATVVTVTPKKKEIADAIKGGKLVPGARLEQGEPSLMVR